MVRKDAFLVVRVKRTKLQALKAEAERQEITLSEFVRRLLDGAA